MTTPAVKATGAIKWINAAKRFGLVTRDDGGDDLFASFSQPTEGDEPRELKVTQRVSYDIEPGRHGGQAVNVRIIS
jgi:CspA family cold shock protein